MSRALWSFPKEEPMLRHAAFSRESDISPSSRPYVSLITDTAISAGASVYDVAKMLGDTVETVETVEKHYAPFVPALRERVRRIMESGGGLESTGTKTAQSPAKPM